MHEDARDTGEGCEGAPDALQPVRVPEIVAGVDDEVGFEVCKRCQPLLFAVLPRRHVSVGQVQYPQSGATGREGGGRRLPHGEQVAFDPDSPDGGTETRGPRHAERGESRRSVGGAGHSHTTEIVVPGGTLPPFGLCPLTVSPSSQSSPSMPRSALLSVDAASA